MKSLDLAAYGVEEMNEIEITQVQAGGNFTDGIGDGCQGEIDRDRYGKNFWYTVGWGIGKTLKDSAES